MCIQIYWLLFLIRLSSYYWAMKVLIIFLIGSFSNPGIVWSSVFSGCRLSPFTKWTALWRSWEPGNHRLRPSVFRAACCMVSWCGNCPSAGQLGAFIIINILIVEHTAYTRMCPSHGLWLSCACLWFARTSHCQGRTQALLCTCVWIQSAWDTYSWEKINERNPCKIWWLGPL